MSDHFSGPRALAGPAGDICDVYTFPSPERPGHLVLGNGARISDRVDRATVPASEDVPYMAPPNPGGPQLGEFAKLVRPQVEAPKGGRP